MKVASFEVYREFYFEAAHALYDPEAQDGGKYRNLHGHSFRVRVTVRGERQAEEQWVIDLGKLGQLRLHLVVVDDAPLLPLFHEVRVSAYNTRVSGLELNAQSFPLDRFTRVDLRAP